MPERAGYTLLQILLHWLTAALVVIQVLFHDGMEDAFDDLMDGDVVEAELLPWVLLHASTGIAIFALAVTRLSARAARGTPPIHRDKPMAIVWLARATHAALYALLLLMPIAGALAWFGKIEVAGDIHSAAASIRVSVSLRKTKCSVSAPATCRITTGTRMLAAAE
jgi:cytochrome b561